MKWTKEKTNSMFYRLYKNEENVTNESPYGNNIKETRG